MNSNNMNRINQLNQQQYHHQQELFNHSFNDFNKATRPIQNSSNKFPKKIVKSSTTMFHHESSSAHNSMQQHQFFPHSTSYDNMSSLNKLSTNNKQMKPLVNDFLSTTNSNDFLLENPFQNTNSANKYGYYNQHNSMNGKANLQQKQQVNASQNSSVLNSSTSSGSGKDLPILHVRNLDYKISADEWKRILLENFRKHCKEVS